MITPRSDRIPEDKIEKTNGSAYVLKLKSIAEETGKNTRERMIFVEKHEPDIERAKWIFCNPSVCSIEAGVTAVRADGIVDREVEIRMSAKVSPSGPSLLRRLMG